MQFVLEKNFLPEDRTLDISKVLAFAFDQDTMNALNKKLGYHFEWQIKPSSEAG